MSSALLPSSEDKNNNNDGLAGYTFFTDNNSAYSYQFTINQTGQQQAAMPTNADRALLLTANPVEPEKDLSAGQAIRTPHIDKELSAFDKELSLPPLNTVSSTPINVNTNFNTTSSSSTIDLLDNALSTLQNAVASQARNQGGSVVTFQPGQDLPSSVVDESGKKAQFTYDAFGKLSSLSERTTERWLRTGEPDENGVALWISSDGREQRAAITVYRDGSYEMNADGTITKVNGWGELSVEYSQKQARERVCLLVKMFERADTNRDMRLSKAELEAAVALTDLSALELEILNTLKTTHATIEWTKRGMFGLEERGVSLVEILEFRSDKAPGASARFPETAVKTAEKAFDCCDRFTAGSVTNAQIAEAASSRSTDGAIRLVLEQMSSRLQGLAYYSSYGFDGRLNFDRSQFREVFLSLNDVPHYKEDFSALAPETNLYANPAERLSSICMSAVGNGTAGDGIFLSVLAGLARNLPHAILNMIRPMDDGSFVVTFSGDPGHPVRVMPPSLPEFRQYGKAGDFGTWAIIMEKAFDLYLSQRELWASQGTPALPCESAHDLIELLTGQPGNWHNLEGVENAELSEFLSKMIRERRLICLGSWKQGKAFNQPGIWNHAHSLIDYDSELQILKLRNAFGVQWRAEDGGVIVKEDILQVPLADLSSRFDILFFEARWA